MIKRLVLMSIRGYQLVSQCFPAHCRFYPTCSNYTIEAVQMHGIVLGLWLGFRRICRCHPWNAGGVDPVPKVIGRSSKLAAITRDEWNDLK